VCLELFKDRIYLQCFNESCNAKFEKGIGVVIDDAYYCSQECSADVDDIHQAEDDCQDQAEQPYTEQPEKDEYYNDESYDPMTDF
jgi:hypothetical protein